ncbi:GGDEF domain-containing protein [Brevibacillus fluminis]|uniref:GGDEF domain-containing protein n=1 Tax=Brevibacillus fluminis TaxID=511487 RepID=A0A3M8D310_9BACL|nr:bifunctional diguanylate cyclase/phosphodiesterase [Brevibacillus fluminis]RNB81575.1 GGDEF domain-containing protein [Brevibacillus fluminis]
MFFSWMRSLQKWPVFLRENRVEFKNAIAQELRKESAVILFYVDIVRLTEIENRYGDMTAKRVLTRYEQLLPEVAQSILGIKGLVLGIVKLWGDDFAIYASFPNGTSEEEYRLLSISVQDRVESLMNQQIKLVNREDLRVRIGYAQLAGRDVTKEMYTSMKHAIQMAKYGLTTDKYSQIRQFHHILKQEEVQMLFMPIASLKDGEPLGWEALARGPENSQFYSPAALFSYAEETDSVFRLEQLCRKRAFEQLRYLQPHQKMFINLDPRAIDDPFLLRGQALRMLEESNLNPGNIVFEITERHAITNYQVFRKVIEEYRKKGYLIAVDDAGAGYSSLESITEIYPDYIKLDMSLIRGIDTDSIKQALLETIVQFAEKVKCKIIAEGIETEKELNTLMEIGVPYGQGYFLGKPAKGMTKIKGDALTFIDAVSSREENRTYFHRGHFATVGEITTKTVVAKKDMRVRQVHQLFEQNQRIDSIVVLDGEKPVGMLMRFQLYQILGGQYGIALYYERPVSQVMNYNPLIVEQSQAIDEVAKLAMARDAYHLYDVVIATDQEGAYAGIVSVQSLLDKMASIKLELATFANPLTGLPGNVQIERELGKRLYGREPFIVIYCDLDRFKWFNDQFGFETGDQIIRSTTQLLKNTIQAVGNRDDFIGHIGGDDFIIITTDKRMLEVTSYLMESFDTSMADLYERRRKCTGELPILSLSLAGLYVHPERYRSVEEIAEQAAVLKKRAKQLPGTSFVTDYPEYRRSVEAGLLAGE